MDQNEIWYMGRRHNSMLHTSEEQFYPFKTGGGECKFKTIWYFPKNSKTHKCLWQRLVFQGCTPAQRGQQICRTDCKYFMPLESWNAHWGHKSTHHACPVFKRNKTSQIHYYLIRFFSPKEFIACIPLPYRTTVVTIVTSQQVRLREWLTQWASWLSGSCSCPSL